MYSVHHPIEPAKKQKNEKVTYYMLGTGTYCRLTLYWNQDWITIGPEAMNRNLVQKIGKEVLHSQIRTT